MSENIRKARSKTIFERFTYEKWPPKHIYSEQCIIDLQFCLEKIQKAFTEKKKDKIDLIEELKCFIEYLEWIQYNTDS